MKKHAYLIMAHNNFSVLEKLLLLLDDARNDIYIHIDKKTMNFNYAKIREIIKKSNLFFTEQIDVYWGDYSQIEAEMILLKSSFKEEYEYYHLLSGVDMPLKTQDEIHDFFDNNGNDYIQFVNEEFQHERNAIYRISRYKFFQKYMRDNNVIKKKAAELFQCFVMPLQTILKVNRLKNKNIKLGYGANWFSLTNNTVGLVLSKEDFIIENFRHTLCADEIFIQTIIRTFSQSEIKYDKDFNGTSHVRLIDWNRGNPYIFRKLDFERLISSSCLFARKFDENIDMEIVQLLYDYLKQ